MPTEFPSCNERLFKYGKGENEENIRVIKKGNTVYRIQCVFEGSKDIDEVLIRLAFKNADRDKR